MARKPRSSQASTSHSIPPDTHPIGQWEGRALLRQPHPPTTNEIPQERQRLSAVIKSLKAQVQEIDRVLAASSVTRRQLKNLPLGQQRIISHDMVVARLRSKHARALRRISICEKRKITYVQRPFYHHSGYPCVQAYNIGEPSCICEFCGAVMWREESIYRTRSQVTPQFSLCCNAGKVKLPPRREPPEFLKQLLESSNSAACHFKEFIRPYNGIFCFISLGGKVNRAINDGRGVYVYSISGQIYHRIGGLVPVPGERPKFAQLYIHDTENEVQNRMNFFPVEREANPLRQDIIEGLKQVFDNNNILAQTFRSARDRVTDPDFDQVRVKLCARRSGDGKEYDLPTGNEIAALIVDETGQESFEPDIIIQHQTSELERVSLYHPSLMALQYPILFPYGEDGWHPNIEQCLDLDDEDKKPLIVSQCDYYSYRLQTRFDQSNSLLLAGKLLQQYMVNAYALVEAERLDWIRNNQSKLRRHYYSGLVDSFLRGDTDLKLSGKHIILAATHTGSPRYKYENFQDAMAICRWTGYPDLFITFTCNANWPEIQFMVDIINANGRKDYNRADVTARVFRLKLIQLMFEIRKKKIFGKTSAYVQAIEFQKRGLPHAHILVFLAAESKITTPSEIDSVISAEIPDQNLDPEGYNAVTSFMMHGPCGSASPTAQCMENGNCKKHFPKQFCNQTTIDKNGFAKYRRRNNGTVIVNGVDLDNRYVVPYNRYLLLRFLAHINVEFCNRSRAIKYLFKYINKAADRATATLVGNQISNISPEGSSTSTNITIIDEVKAFLDCRYITSGEACWRLFKFDIYNQFPAVLRMSFHLPGENTVHSKDTSNIEDVLHSKKAETSMLLAWMAMNSTSQEARQYTFVDFPQYYVWNAQDRKWQKRKSRSCIGRLYYSSPSTKERYYLRMLLHVVKGARSFEEVRTVNGVTHDSFQEACYAYGLLAEDNEWDNCITEVAFWGSGARLRKLFVTILMHCRVSNIGKFWENNWKLLSDDLLHSRRKELRMPNLILCDADLKNLCLVEIDKLLQRHWKSLADFPGLPTPNGYNVSTGGNRMIAEELNYSQTICHSQFEELYPKLNHQQNMAFDEIIKSVNEDQGRCFFIDGFGGTGKTFLWQLLCLKLRSERKIVLCVASSGIAALLMDGGRTAHSRFHIPIDADSTATCHIEQGSELAELIQATSLIIWDEATMAHKHSIEALDRSLRDILSTKYPNNDDIPFGGVTVVFGGDFRQTLPIIEKGTRSQIIAASLKSSYLWHALTVVKLTENMRLAKVGCTSEEVEQIYDFGKWLLQIGDGIQSDIFGESLIPIPPELRVERATDPIHDIVSSTYPHLTSSASDSTYLVGRAILAPHHNMVSNINTYVLQKFPGEEVSYYSSDSIEVEPGNEHNTESDYTVEFLNSLKIGNFPDHELKLKVGCPVILLRNMDQSTGLCNGTRMTVTRLGTWFIEVQILTGTHIGDTVFLPRLTLATYYRSLNFTLIRRQYPIALCFAMTVNKSQGQTLQHVGLCLQKQVFAHGQLYVALSRVTTKSGVKILSSDDKGDELMAMQNIVYQEILN